MPHVLGKFSRSTQVFARTNVDFYTASRAASTFWSNVPMGPPDVILGITEAYKRDTDPKKVNLGVGAYRDDEGKPFILPSVRKAEESIYQKCMNHEYSPIGGEAVYTKAVAELAFGDRSLALKEKTNCTVQTLSGTGALRLGLEFATKHYGKVKEVWLPTPTWGNHPQICNMINLPHKKYRYYDAKTHGFDLQGACDDICVSTIYLIRIYYVMVLSNSIV
uniref:Aspartate aminotransferase, mitochondrial n=1 Tax=Heliothis virescens TaxID=7102 RepID=A0A2A4K1D0_HELVI